MRIVSDFQCPSYLGNWIEKSTFFFYANIMENKKVYSIPLTAS